MKQLPDGNIAFKVIWVYGELGPFSSPCSSRGRKINVVQDKKVWCSQPDCNCYKIYHQKRNVGDYWQHYPNKNDLDEWPCYDAAVFNFWQFGAGIYHHGRNKNRPIPIKHCKPGKLAFLTSRESGSPESDRRIIGCFSIAGMKQESGWGNVLIAGPIRLRVANVRQAPFYWSFRSGRPTPFWGSGLFRYIPDGEAQAMLNALSQVT